ncbi:MAG TPA: PepSY-associated TM helix domain-containing protein [Thermoanaerobaculia bacterium]|nr:PepSY-associated TM helix domain-containing protein [Thermoanaerobaculia bacterium]
MKSIVRRFLLGLHRYLGLAAAAFLVVAGLTGSILAFAEDYDRWTHPSLWRVTPQGALLSEQTLVDRVRGHLATEGSTARIEQIRLAGDHSSQLFALTDGRTMFVNPYTGAVLGTADHPSKVSVFVGWVHQLHVRLLAGNYGQWFVDIATAAVFLLVPTGVYLWWARKRLTLKWTSSWRRITWDLHNVVGVYGCVLIFLLASTGLLIAFETPLYWMARSEPWRPGEIPHSVQPGLSHPDAQLPKLDELMLAADRTLPDSETYQIQLPMRPRSSLQIMKRRPGVAGHSTVYFDRYDGHILRVDDLSKLPRAYRAHLTNQAIHMGTILGLPSKILMSLSSVLLVVLVVTGCVMWWPGRTKRMPRSR